MALYLITYYSYRSFSYAPDFLNGLGALVKQVYREDELADSSVAQSTRADINTQLSFAPRSWLHARCPPHNRRHFKFTFFLKNFPSHLRFLDSQHFFSACRTRGPSLRSARQRRPNGLSIDCFLIQRTLAPKKHPEHVTTQA